jgi:hypothetical protein
MTRDEAIEIVSGPGKFEQCAPYVPYFWDQYLNGMADEDDGQTLTFRPTAEDKALFPELASVDAVYIMEDDLGFVNEVDGPSEDWPEVEDGE